MGKNQDDRKKKALSAEHPRTYKRQVVVPVEDQVKFADGTRIPKTDGSVYYPIDLEKLRKK
jgi:hypothetical protein